MARRANMSYLQTGDQRSFKDALEKRRATLHNHGGSAQVEMQWDLNENDITDQIFKLVITQGDSKTEILLNKEEMLHWIDAV